MAIQRKRPATLSTVDPLTPTSPREDVAAAEQSVVATRTKNAKAAKSARNVKPVKAVKAAEPEKPIKPIKPIKPAKPAKAAKTAGKASTVTADAKADKPKKPKLMRDSFTIPKAEYAVIESLKQRAALGGRPAKKSELLRAGLKALAAMDDPGFMAAVGQVPTIKTGRPAKA